MLFLSISGFSWFGIAELPNGGGLMSCADASQACLGAYEPALIITPSQVMATRWGEFEQRRSSTIDPVEFLLALTERKTLAGIMQRFDGHGAHGIAHA